MRVILFASATTATFSGRRAVTCNAHSGGALLPMRTDRAP